MKSFLFLAFLLVAAVSELRAQDFLDRLEERLTITAFDDNLSARVSGTLDLEYYHFQQPPPGLIEAAGSDLFNPRLTMFFDAQIGAQVYFFAQARLDRHFDPTDDGAQVRLDEYALRVTLLDESRLIVGVGKFATVISKWVERHHSWDNPFINAPLAYENITLVEDRAVPPAVGGATKSPRETRIVIAVHTTVEDNKSDYLPIIWGPSYSSGASVIGQLGKFEYAAEIKNAALASRPESWDLTRNGFKHPTISGRIGFRPSQMWNFGLAASEGPYLRPEARVALPFGRDIGDYDQIVLAQDVSFAWRHWQLWAEFHEARFEVPNLGNVDTFAYFLEAKYKITPQLFGALRWNQQFFNEVSFARDISRLEAAVAYRFTTHTQVKLQYYVDYLQPTPREFSHTFAAQFTVRF